VKMLFMAATVMRTLRLKVISFLAYWNNFKAP
jgi:hypothetical protein